MKKPFSTYKGMPREIYVLFFARIVNCIGNFVFPFLTLFLTGVMKIEEDKAGFFIMLGSIAGIPGTLLGGALADSIGRKKIMVVSQSMAALCLIPCAFLGNSPVIPWLLILSVFFGAAARPANSAMVADLTSCESRKQAFSLLYLGINIGTAIGPIIAGFLFKRHIAWLFLGDAATTFISILLVVAFVRETKPSREHIECSLEEGDSDEKAEKGSVLAILFKRPLLLWFTLINAVLLFIYSQHGFSLPIFSNELFKENGASVYGTLMTTNALVVVFLTTLLTIWTRNLKPVINIAIASLTFAVGFGMLFFVRDYFWLLLSTIIWTVGEILITTNSQVYIANHAPISHRGRFNAVIPFITGIGSSLGPLIMGGFIKDHGVNAVWPVVFLLSTVAALLMYGLSLLEKRQSVQLTIDS